jgi:hypothetical protein
MAEQAFDCLYGVTGLSAPMALHLEEISLAVAPGPHALGMKGPI